MRAISAGWLAGLALVAFAANSVLARAALDRTGIDPVTFTAVRIVSGAAVLLLLVRLRASTATGSGSWASALALFGYAIAFSLAYRSLSAATGALLLFGAVQATMIGWGLARGESLSMRQWIGALLAMAGLVWMLLPGLAAPPPGAAALMLAAGTAWGIYTLRARGVGDPTAATAANFTRAAVPALILALFMANRLHWDAVGLGLAIASGAVASGVGYAVWYAALREIGTHAAAVSQLSVPVITAIAGVLLLSEPLTPRMLLAGAAILGGIAMVVQGSRSSDAATGRG